MSRKPGSSGSAAVAGDEFAAAAPTLGAKVTLGEQSSAPSKPPDKDEGGDGLLMADDGKSPLVKEEKDPLDALWAKEVG